MKNKKIEINNIRNDAFENKNIKNESEKNILKETYIEKKTVIINTKPPQKTKLFYDDKSIIEVRNESYFIYNKKPIKEPDIYNIIKNNLYNILLENEYIALNKYFLFKKFIIGLGKFGTVWIGLNLQEANFVAIKLQNNEKSKKYLDLEAIIIQKLKRYKIFSKLYDKLVFNNSIYLIQSLHCPNLNKFKNFCGSKFSANTIYKIGIEILRCLNIFITMDIFILI